MRILVVNPNSSDDMTLQIDKVAKKAAGIDTKIDTINIKQSPKLLISSIDEQVAAFYLLNEIKTYINDYNGFIIACHGDPGVFAAKEITKKPVIGIGFASIYTAKLFGQNISILTLSDKCIEQKRRLIRSYNIDDKNIHIEPTSFKEDLTINEVKQRLLCSGRLCKEKYNSDVLVLGCAGMAGISELLECELGIPVIDSVVASVHLMKMILKNTTVDINSKCY